MSISLAGLARFGCDLSATVGGIPNFGQTSQSRIRPLRHREKRGPGATRRKGMAWHCARHRAAFINQSGSLGRIMALIPYLRRLPARHLPCVEPGEPRSKSLAGGTIHEWAWPPQFRMRPCVALWQQPGGRGLADSRKRTRCWLHPTQRQITSWALWAADAGVSALLGLRRFHR